MKFSMNIPQAVAGDMRVNLGGADTGVPQQLLDHPQICAMLQQMRRKTMTQHVRCDVPFNPRAKHAILNPEPQGYPRKWSAAPR